MTLLLAGLAVLLAGGILALPAGRSPRLAVLLGAGSAVLGGALGMIPAARVLLGAPPESLRLPWQVPYGSFALEIDGLSAFFLLPALGLPALAAVFGGGYLRAHGGGRSLGAAWLHFNALTASMALALVARNAVLFLAAWEAMALASFFLVASDDEDPGVREAGCTYLIAAHLGTAFLLAFFALAGRGADTLDFDRMGAGAASPGLLFALALVGFGTKAGLMPLHVWLPEAHPAAPSHVSAVMSAVMVQTGVYGLLRSLSFLGPPPAWWGWLLTGAGLVSAVLGAAFALAQRDIKRALAYSTVENAGIIAIAIGLGLLGASHGRPYLAALGFAGALLHVLNHALLKGLLFLAAGCVLRGAGTRDLERLGGLGKRMPWTAALAFLGAIGIAGLPPLNGFTGEFLILLGGIEGAAGPAVPGAIAAAIPALAAVAGLALTAGLAAAAFTRIHGIAFLGEPRSEEAARARDPGSSMLLPMLFLAAGCILLGLGAPAILPALAPIIGAFSGLAAGTLEEALARAAAPLAMVIIASWTLAALAAALALVRIGLLAGRRVGRTGTWDCGYARPGPRMQYSASSFAQPLTGLLAAVLRTRRRLVPPEGLFPASASLQTETPDAWREAIYRPAFAGLGRVLARLRWLQHGRIQLYILYIALTLLLLLIWELRS